MLIDRTLRDLLAAFSAPDPTPGGGSASALASAVGASLLMMVGGMPKTRTGAPEERTALDASARTLAGIRDRLSAAIDADSAAYDRVVAAYKLPKTTPADQEARKVAIQHALGAATDIPLDVMRLSAAALAEAATIGAHGHAGAASDVGVGVALLRAGLHGARLNVEINLGAIRDDAYIARIREEVANLESARSS